MLIVAIIALVILAAAWRPIQHTCLASNQKASTGTMFFWICVALVFIPLVIPFGFILSLLTLCYLLYLLIDYHLKKDSLRPYKELKEYAKAMGHDNQQYVYAIVRFSYTNAKGQYADRRVAVTGVGHKYLRGKDLRKDAERTFRYDRMNADLIIEDTGEVIAPNQIYSHFRE